MTFGSYINKDSNESNGCAPMGFASNGNPTYTGVKTPGACANKILLSVSNDGGGTFTGTGADPRTEELVTQSRGQTHTDQFWQWARSRATASSRWTTTTVSTATTRRPAPRTSACPGATT